MLPVVWMPVRRLCFINLMVNLERIETTTGSQVVKSSCGTAAAALALHMDEEAAEDAAAAPPALLPEGK